MSDWRKICLGNLGTTYTGLSGKTKEEFGKGSSYIPYLNIFGNARINPEMLDKVVIKPHETQNKVRRGDIFFTTSSETVNEVGMTSVLLNDLPDTYLNSFCFGFRPNNFDDLIPEFAVHLLRGQEARSAIVYHGQGSTRYNISKTALLRRTFLNLPPVSEQWRIAEILDTADEAIQKTEALIAKLNQMKAGLLHDLLTRGIDENGELRPPATTCPSLYKPSKLGLIPSGWKLEPLMNFSSEEIGAFVNGPFGSDLLTRELTTEGVPVIYVRDIKPSNYTRVSTSCVTKLKADQLRVCNVLYGDVLISKVGDPPCDAAPYLLHHRSVITQDVIRIRPCRNVDPVFLAALFNASIGRSAIRRIVIEGTRARVSLTELKQLELPMPTPHEQSEIGNRLKASDAKIDVENRILIKLKTLKAALVHDLLSGKKQVNPLDIIKTTADR